jgi:L-threonylcarbamoyladenylate synthase
MIVADDDDARKRAAKIVAGGGVIAFRTDTFYGLGADPFNRTALKRIARLKEREGRKPILVLISEKPLAQKFIAKRTRLFDELSRRHWPGALTLVAKARDEVPEEITAGTGTIGVRLPDDEDVQEFLRACGGSLTATSANLAGRVPARTAPEVAAYFPTELDLIVDAGSSRTDKPSTVLDVSRENLALLIREGEVSAASLRETLNAIDAQMEYAKS